MCMVRTERFKYCFNFKPRQIDELYDLKGNPWEMENLAPDPNYKGVVAEMQRLFFRWMEGTRYPWAEEAKEAAEFPCPFVKAINFEFERPSEAVAWEAHRGISGLRWERAVCHLDEPVSAEDCPVIVIRMRTTAGKQAQFYWAMEEEPEFEERFHEYRLELGSHPLWRGRKRERLAACFEIDSLKCVRAGR